MFWPISLLQTVSFLTYLLKSFADFIRPHEESISKSIVNLLVSCPDSVTIRKVCVLLVVPHNRTGIAWAITLNAFWGILYLTCQHANLLRPCGGLLWWIGIWDVEVNDYSLEEILKQYNFHEIQDKIFIISLMIVEREWDFPSRLLHTSVVGGLKDV